MSNSKMNIKGRPFERSYIYIEFLTLLLISIIFLSSNKVSAAPPEVIIEDCAPRYVNESNAPVCILNLNLTDDDNAMLTNITVTVENASGSFDPNLDLAALSGDNTSGIMIYTESNAIPGFQSDDNPIGIVPTVWSGGGPWFTEFNGIGRILPNSTSGYNYYVVIRTAALISNDDQFRVGIEANGILTDQGQIPSTSIWSKVITADTIAPYPNIYAYSETIPLKVGDWINITATIAGDDATDVTINLSDFNGLSDSEPMVYNSASSVWYYNITSLLEGAVDTGFMPYIFNVSATDKSGKIASGINLTIPVDTISPIVSVVVDQENIPAGIDNWINISVTTDMDAVAVNVDLDSAGFSGQNDNQTFIPIAPGTWFFNFTVMDGTSDGSNTINVDVMDDAGNTAFNNTAIVYWDEAPPQVSVVVLQESMPAGIGDWINVTVTTDTDVLFVIGDFSAFSGQGASQLLSNPGTYWFHNFTVSPGVLDGSGTINVTVTDDAGYIMYNNTQKAVVDEISPTLTVTVIQSSSPAGIGDWINISVSTVVDVVDAVGDLSAFSGQGASQVFNGHNTTWYYNFTVSPGLLDGFGLINITVFDDGGNTEYNDSESAHVDEIAPIIDVAITQSNTSAAIGDWINITVTTDGDTTSVQANLATAGFTGQIDNQNLFWAGTYWYYQFFVAEGTFDGFNIIEVYAMDDAGNLGFNVTEIASWDEIIPTVALTVSFESSPTAIDDWINITVTTDVDVVDVTGDLSAFSGRGFSEIFVGSGFNWYYNFTLQPGTLDGFGMINVSVTDDAGNANFNNSAAADVDEIAPTLNVIINQGAIPSAIGDWINITVTTDTDAFNVIGDISAFAGQGASQPFIGSSPMWYYNFTVQVGLLDGPGMINVTVIDNAGNSKFDDTKVADVDEVMPTVFNVHTSNIVISESMVGQIFYLNITYSENMNTVVNPNIMFLNPSLVGTLSFIQGAWDGATVFRAQYSISDDNTELQNIDIEVSGAFDLAGNLQVLSTSIDIIDVDTVRPTILITVNEESSPAAIGEWINITVATDVDVSVVDIDLAQAGFSGQTNDQVLIRIDPNTWYYNFTVSPGITDASLGVALNVDAIDDAGNINSNSADAYFDEVYPEPISIEIKTESQPGKVNDWININVDVGAHLDIESILVDAPGVFSSEPITQHPGNLWYLNTSISQGTADGQINFTVTLLDDAGNLISVSSPSLIDNVPPNIAEINEITDGTATTPDTQFRGILTINAQTDSNDIYKVSFYDGDPAGEGIWLGDDFEIPFSFEWVTNASDFGVHHVYIRVYDDAGNFKDSSGTEITISNILKEPDSGIPLEYVLIIGFIAAISAGSIFIAATEIGRIPLFFFFYLLYTRLKKEYVLDNFTRGRIYGFVEANPGEHFNAIKRALDLKNGSLAYHLRTLEREGFINSKRDRGYTRYYPKSMKLPKRNVKELIPIQRNIVDCVKFNPGISQRGIADKLNISYQLVHYHIKVLQEADYLYLEKDEKQTYCYDSEARKLDSESEDHYLPEGKLEDGTAEF